MVHSEMCDNWGYERLHKLIEKRAIDEMKHAEKLIARILFLDGRPIVSNLKKINIGAEVPAQHQNDWDAEDGAIKSYNDGIRLALELGDNGSRELMDSILEGRGNSYRLDRSSTRRDQADGRRELPGGADRLIPSCAQVEATEKRGEVTSPHPARFGRARLRATKRSALAAVAQHLLGPAAAPYKQDHGPGMERCSRGAPSQKIGRELEAWSIGSMYKREPERSEGSEANVPPTPELFSFFWYHT